MATQGVVPPVRIESESVEVEGRRVLAVHVAEGAFKPYKDTGGNIWVKRGADKRRTTDKLEILSLLQESGLCHPDETEIPGAVPEDLDDRLVAAFFRAVHGRTPEEFGVDYRTLLANLRILGTTGRPTQGGLLFFGRVPQWRLPSCAVKAVAFSGTDLAGTSYRDSKDIEGTLPEQFERGMSFLKANLRNVQNGRSVNTTGELEIPEIALEELFQNALVHRDYLIPAAIRLLVFNDRVEIVSPGCLADGLSVEAIRMGTSFQRNPLLASLCAKTMRYRGLGSGILRAIRACGEVFLENDESGRVFRAVLRRPAAGNAIAGRPNRNSFPGIPEETGFPVAVDTPEAERVFRAIGDDPRATLTALAERTDLSVSTVRRILGRLRAAGVVRREGARKNGVWKTVASASQPSP